MTIAIVVVVAVPGGADAALSYRRDYYDVGAGGVDPASSWLRYFAAVAGGGGRLLSLWWQCEGWRRLPRPPD